MNSRYSTTEKKQVLALREKGASYVKIAKRFGIPVPTVGHWIRLEIKKSRAKAKKYGSKFRTGKKRN